MTPLPNPMHVHAAAFQMARNAFAANVKLFEVFASSAMELPLIQFRAVNNAITLPTDMAMALMPSAPDAVKPAASKPAAKPKPVAKKAAPKPAAKKAAPKPTAKPAVKAATAPAKPVAKTAAADPAATQAPKPKSACMDAPISASDF